MLKSGAAVKFKATQVYSSSDLTKANVSINKPSTAEKENVVWQINTSNFLACEKKKINMLMTVMFTNNVYIQTIPCLCTQSRS
jgi:hypothetical protein